jgi:hypothetical protein
LPDQLAVGSAYSVFQADGSIADEAMAKRVQSLGSGLARHLQKMLA